MLIINNINSLQKLNVFAKKIAFFLKERDRFCIIFNGDIGVGKTTLIRLILIDLGITEYIKSPSYSILEEYQLNKKRFMHFDLYRIKNIQSWFNYDFSEFLELEKRIIFIEWPKVALSGLIPYVDLELNLTAITQDERIIEVNYHSEIGKIFYDIINHNN